MRSRKFANPFYSLLLVAGLAFAMTAVAYVVMAFRERDAGVNSAAVRQHPLMAWMGDHGETALMAELGVLALGTFGAIATDDYWQRREKLKQPPSKKSV